METPVVYLSEALREQLKSHYGTVTKSELCETEPMAAYTMAASKVYSYLVKHNAPEETMEEFGYLVDELLIPYLLVSDEAEDH